ncbi:SLC4A11 [Lepeophtheirus salmonis]|uniref:SLC4A11 n=1 Tax=Lepeophtheirus salmonis TaxID=72036 RepID=A0A7R8CX18_LEPSM|nr:SLC4A11 [Lepeophtheirus salmonis]CAF2956812.1 SLC4A11 [Lepeophtheirus salmonis]
MSIRRRFSSFREAKEITSSPASLNVPRRSLKKNHHIRPGGAQSGSHSRWCNTEGFAGKIWYLHYDNGEEVKLLYTERDTVRFKDFSTEVRCVMDMDCLLDEAIILLDTCETSLRGIINSLLYKLLETLKVPFLFDEALSNIFLPESGSVLSKVIQGMIGFHGEMLESDQSWIITVATVNALPRRALGIKETKSAKETGRTFATLLADINFRSQLLKRPYLQAGKREVLTDYALPVAVICFSFVGSHFFRDVKMAPFKLINLSEAFNITASIVNNPDNKLVKGTSYHWDLFVIGVLNIPFSIFCLPWMHAVLPHSPLHVRSLADVQEHVEEGHVYDIIVKVRETRITSLVANLLIGLSIFFLGDYLRLIPVPVLDGLFLYLAVTALNGNQLFERFTLLFMEQTAYPPNHYIRRVPQRKIHQFTAIQPHRTI